MIAKYWQTIGGEKIEALVVNLININSRGKFLQKCKRGGTLSMEVNQIDTVDTDVLIVGGGAAGIWAAIRAKEVCPKVVLVEKGKFARSGATTFIHGILAPVPEENLYLSMKEIVEEGEYACIQSRLEQVLREHGERIRQMENWGVPFLRDSSGRLYSRKGKKHVVNRAIYAEGIPLLEKMKEHALKIGVEFIERVMITDLLTSDGQHPTEGRVMGAVGIHTRTGQFQVFKAKAVVLTSGGASARLHIGQIDNLAGDGMAIALRAGAELSGMEFGQMPFFPIVEKKFTCLPPGALTTYEAELFNRLGERIPQKYFPGRTTQMLNRMQIGQIMAKENLEGRGPVYIDLSHWSDETIERLRRLLPQDWAGLDEHGFNIRKQRLEADTIVPVWYSNEDGGVRTDLDGSSSVSGLFAAGSCAHDGVNPADSSGTTQAGCYGAGYKAGQSAGKLALDTGEVKINSDQVKLLRKETFLPLGRSSGPTSEDIYLAVNKATIPAQFSYFKHERRIRYTLAELKRVQEEMIPRVTARDIHELVKANEARNFVSTLEAAYKCALERKESRRFHYREEYPYRDDIEWLKWVIIKRSKDGMTTRFDPIPIDDYPIKLDKRTRIPAAVQFSWKG